MRTIEEIKADIARRETDYAEYKPETEKMRHELRAALTVDIPLDRLEAICTAERLIGRTAYCIFAGVKKVAVRQICGYEATARGVKMLANDGSKGYPLADVGDFGKTFFLTPEEAEKALEGQK